MSGSSQRDYILSVVVAYGMEKVKRAADPPWKMGRLWTKEESVKFTRTHQEMR